MVRSWGLQLVHFPLGMLSWRRGSEEPECPASTVCIMLQIARLPYMAKGFLVAQLVKNLPACRKPGLDSWVGKILWRREWLPTPLVLPGQFHGQRNLAGYSAWGCIGSDKTERLSLTWLKPEHWFNHENNEEAMTLLCGHSDCFSFGQSCPRCYFCRGCFMKIIGFLNPMPSLFLDLVSHLFQPHSSMFNAITLDLDITNKYTTAKMSQCQALTFFTWISSLLSPFPHFQCQQLFNWVEGSEVFSSPIISHPHFLLLPV